MKSLFFLCILSIQILFATQISYKVDNKKYKTSSSVYLKPTQTLMLRFHSPKSKSIKWYQIIPDTSRFYKNANHPWEKNAYKWTGYGKITYKKVEIKAFRNKQIVEINTAVLQANKPPHNPYYQSKLGSFWFEVEATLKSGKVIRSYGLKNTTNKGLSPKVFRVSYWLGNHYMGYLSSFFNVPGIFGSMPYQSTNHIGVDCADVLVAASTLMHKRTKVKNYNVAMLTKKLKIKVKTFIKNGTPRRKLYWGKTFKKGDFIAVKYSKNGRYAHIGLLYNDSNKNGILDKEDKILNAGPQALHLSPLKSGAFDGEIVILHNKDIK